MKTFDHPNVLTLLNYNDTGKELTLSLPLSTGPTLEAYIASCHSYTVNDKIFVMRQILCGLQYLHGLLIAHGRIKPKNIHLMDSTARPLVKLSDFKLSLGFKDRSFTSPELIKHDANLTVSLKMHSDVYAAGVCFSEILKGNLKIEYCKNSNRLYSF